MDTSLRLESETINFDPRCPLHEKYHVPCQERFVYGLQKRAFWKYAKPATRTTFALIAAFQLLLLLTSGIRDIMNTDFFRNNNILYVNIIRQISINHRFLLASINIFVLIIL